MMSAADRMMMMDEQPALRCPRSTSDDLLVVVHERVTTNQRRRVSVRRRQILCRVVSTFSACHRSCISSTAAPCGAHGSPQQRSSSTTTDAAHINADDCLSVPLVLGSGRACISVVAIVVAAAGGRWPASNLVQCIDFHRILFRNLSRMSGRRRGLGTAAPRL